jgi:hypothetical protein
VPKVNTPVADRVDSTRLQDIRDIFKVTQTQAEEMGLSDLNLKGLDFAELQKTAEIAVIPGAVDKESLVGVPFIIVGWADAFSENYQRPYVKVAVVTEQNEPKTFVDFGSSIGATLQALGDRKNVYCAEGLRASRYDSHESKVTGETVPGGVTFYLT